MATAGAVGLGSSVTVSHSAFAAHRAAGSGCYGSGVACYYFESLDDESGVDNYITDINDFNYDIVGAYKTQGNYDSFSGKAGASPAPTPPAYTFSSIPDYQSESTFAQGLSPSSRYTAAYALPASGPAVGLILHSNGNWTTIIDPHSGSCTGGTHVLSINDAEQGVGYYDKPGKYGCEPQAFEFYTIGNSSFAYVDLGPSPPPGQAYMWSTASSINTLGDVVGTVSTPSGTTSAWLYSELDYYHISFKADETYGRGVNFNDGVVGYYYDSSGNTHGFYNSAPKQNPSPAPITIDFILNQAPVKNTVVNSINTNWAISGWYDKGDNIEHGFVATCKPCPNAGSSDLRKDDRIKQSVPKLARTRR